MTINQRTKVPMQSAPGSAPPPSCGQQDLMWGRVRTLWHSEAWLLRGSHLRPLLCGELRLLSTTLNDFFTPLSLHPVPRLRVPVNDCYAKIPSSFFSI